MKHTLTIWLLTAIAATAALVVEPSEVEPGGYITLRLEVDPNDEALGASIYFHASGTFPIVARTTDFDELLIEDAQLTSISTSRSMDMGGLFDPPRAEPFSVVLTLEAPGPGNYVLYVDTQSLVLLADFSTVPLIGEGVAVRVVPESSPWFMLGFLGICRFRNLVHSIE